MQQRDVIINSRRALGAAEFAREHASSRKCISLCSRPTGKGAAGSKTSRTSSESVAGVGLDATELRSAIDEIATRR